MSLCKITEKTVERILRNTVYWWTNLMTYKYEFMGPLRLLLGSRKKIKIRYFYLFIYLFIWFILCILFNIKIWGGVLGDRCLHQPDYFNSTLTLASFYVNPLLANPPPSKKKKKKKSRLILSFHPSLFIWYYNVFKEVEPFKLFSWV